MSDIQLLTISDMVKAASDNCIRNHKTFHADCNFCRIDQAFLDAVIHNKNPGEKDV